MMVEVDGYRVAYDASVPVLRCSAPWVRRATAVDLGAAARHALRRLHRRRVGCAGGRPIIGSSGAVRHGGLRRLPRPLRRPPRAGASACGRAVLRRRTGDQFCRRHPRSLPPRRSSAPTPDGGGSLPPETAGSSVSVRRSSCPSCRPTSSSTRCSRRCSPHGAPAAGRGRVAAPRCSRSILPASGPWRTRRPRTCGRRCRPIDVPTLLVYGSDDIRAPAAVADHLHEAIRGSTLVRLPGAGHVCNLEAPDTFDTTLREFLRGGRLKVVGRDRDPLSRRRGCSGVRGHAGRLVVGVEQPAEPEREAAAADAAVQAIAQPLEQGDLVVEAGSPRRREPFPVLRGRGAVLGERGERGRGSRRGVRPTCWATRMNEMRRSVSRA